MSKIAWRIADGAAKKEITIFLCELELFSYQ